MWWEAGIFAHLWTKYNSYPILIAKKQVRQFFGLARYYRQFMPDFATIAASLSELTRNERLQKVQWSDECDRPSKMLKEVLCHDPGLLNPNFSKRSLYSRQMHQMLDLGQYYPRPLRERNTPYYN